MKPITKKEWAARGGLMNPRLVRVMRGSAWRYYESL